MATPPETPRVSGSNADTDPVQQPVAPVLAEPVVRATSQMLPTQVAPAVLNPSTTASVPGNTAAPATSATPTPPVKPKAGLLQQVAVFLKSLARTILTFGQRRNAATEQHQPNVLTSLIEQATTYSAHVAALSPSLSPLEIFHTRAFMAGQYHQAHFGQQPDNRLAQAFYDTLEKEFADQPDQAIFNFLHTLKNDPESLQQIEQNIGGDPDHGMVGMLTKLALQRISPQAAKAAEAAATSAQGDGQDQAWLMLIEEALCANRDDFYVTALDDTPGLFDAALVKRFLQRTLLSGRDDFQANTINALTFAVLVSGGSEIQSLRALGADEYLKQIASNSPHQDGINQAKQLFADLLRELNLKRDVQDAPGIERQALQASESEGGLPASMPEREPGPELDNAPDDAQAWIPMPDRAYGKPRMLGLISMGDANEVQGAANLRRLLLTEIAQLKQIGQETAALKEAEVRAQGKPLASTPVPAPAQQDQTPAEKSVEVKLTAVLPAYKNKSPLGKLWKQQKNTLINALASTVTNTVKIILAPPRLLRFAVLWALPGLPSIGKTVGKTAGQTKPERPLPETAPQAAKSGDVGGNVEGIPPSDTLPIDLGRPFIQPRKESIGTWEILSNPKTVQQSAATTSFLLRLLNFVMWHK
ncbi:hypothetical protein QS306_12240 [Paraburkholderia bonniea]|uniref:hypothetical protein n=1 Tax=Paraburkholderia bonniea TaxID=2152891 RepID=UPI0025733C99|nr:hypothetical protein [Paraburkholderia bonniea]WJF89862.1 hypothetical protein QS306_12240 [Paraburkholderia bonniea]WJF93176.1 hypothetical protein QS308_12250 [Paraburkholderia bonniea]